MNKSERPLPFSAPMVRAYQQGLKRVTRRVVKPQPDVVVGADGFWRDAKNDLTRNAAQYARDCCPYGARGDRLYVKEAWRTSVKLDTKSPAEIGAMAVDAGWETPWAPIRYEADGYRANWTFDDWGEPGRYRSSRFMPRWASRFHPEIVSLRVERLWEITTAEAMLEGIPQTGGEAHALGLFDLDREPGHEWDNRTSVENFMRLWDHLNATRAPWASNPYVWRIELSPCR